MFYNNPEQYSYSMLSTATVEDLREYKKNALKILRKNTQYATAKVVEEFFDREIAIQELIEDVKSK